MDNNRFEYLKRICPIPNQDRVAVIPDEVSDETESGLLVIRDRPEVPHTGTVVAVGRGSSNGLNIPRVRVGFRVWHGRFAGIEIPVNDKETEVKFLLMRDDEILAYQSPDPADDDEELPFA